MKYKFARQPLCIAFASVISLALISALPWGIPKSKAFDNSVKKIAAAPSVAASVKAIGSAPIVANTLTVTKTADTNDGTCDADCSLREAVAAANASSADDSIGFAIQSNDPSCAGAVCTITLTNGQLSIDNNGSLTINGPGANLLTISGNNASRIFTTAGGSSLTLNGLKLTTGNAGNSWGGAIDCHGISLLINQTAIVNNRALAGGGLNISSGCVAVITQSTISGNQALTQYGGGMYINGSGTTATLINSTVSGNKSNFNGGGFSVETSTLNLSYSTVAGNTATCPGSTADCGGGGIDNFFSTVNAGTSIIADNNAPNGPEIFGDLNSQNYNLIENTSGVIIGGTTTNDITGVDPQLSALGDYGGTTETRRLLPGSPAIDSGDPGSFPATDQRGANRPFDGDGNSSALPDIGAFEVTADASPTGPNFVVNTLDNIKDGTCDSVHCSLRDAIEAASANPNPSTITFTVSGTIVLDGDDNDVNGLPVLSTDITINGGGNITISGNSARRIMQVNGGNVELKSLTLTNGNSSDAGGAVLLRGGTLTINGSTLSGNTSARDGGAISIDTVNNSAGDLTILNSTISGNTSGGQGGGIYFHPSNSHTLTINNSTLSGNRAVSSGGALRFGGEGTGNLSFVTITGNVTSYADNGGANGGGLFWGSGTLAVRNSLVVGNFKGTASPGANDCFNGNYIGWSGQNLVGSNGSDFGCGTGAGRTTNPNTVADTLGTLASNGGPTQTHSLTGNSPALNQISPAECTFISGAIASTDQRGFGRPVPAGGNCDAGAFETPPPPPDLGNYPATIVGLNGITAVTPDAAPTRTDYTTATTAADFKGTLSVNPSTGVVRVTNAHPASNFPVKVKAFGPDGTQTTTFNLTVTSGTACTGQTIFTSAPNTNVTFASYAVAVTDFNNDGNQDAAIADSQYSVAIRLGNGNGTFTNMPDVAIAATPVAVRAIAVGDFNGDGNVDFATANNQGGSISVRLGDGAGGFTSAPDLSFSDSPLSIATGDFNGDGITDLVATKVLSPRAAIFLGNGLGGFTFSSEVATGFYPESIVVGDFNSDGKLDVATANRDSNVSVRFGDGNGNLTGSTDISLGTLIIPRSIAIGDFNSDGKLDLVTANSQVSTYTVLIGDGAGNFTPQTPVNVGSNPRGVAVGDFNTDGKDDLILTRSTGSASIQLGDGAGGFTALPDISTGTMPEGLAIGDFNGDGKQDFIFANYDFPAYASVRLGGCSNAPTAITAGGPYTISEGDSLTLSGSATDADGDTLTYSWDINGDGVFGDATGQNPTLNWSQLNALGINDGPATINNLKVRVSDGINPAADSAATSLTVNNSAPTLTISGAASTVVAGTYTLNLSSSDPGNDTISSWTINWGDGSSAQVVSGNPSSVTHSYMSANSFTITATATDEDGTYPAGNTVLVTVTCTNNPVVTNANDSGAGSLRQALTDACPGGTITFQIPANDPNHQSNAYTITLTGGELAINKSLTIQGPNTGADTDQIIVSGNNYSSRVFNVSGGVTATLDHLTIADGKVSGGVNSINSGGGILNSGMLTITNSMLSNNTVSGGTSSINNGGAIYNNFGSTLTITDSTLSGNSTSGGSFSTNTGGAISNNGTLMITGSMLSGNSTGGNGNTSHGGAILNGGGTLTITNSTLSGNAATGGNSNEGGGIFNSGTLMITGSTLSNNSVSGAGSTNSGGAIYNDFTTPVTITNSTLSNNSASGGGNLGGGILNSGTLTVTGSTLSGNSVSGGSSNAGGGIVNSSRLTITDSTVSGNSATGGNGGGIINGAFTLNIRNTIIAGNTASTIGPDVRGSFTSQGHNLIGKGDNSTGFTNGTNNDQVGTIASPLDPKLGPLANNGGQTQTLALLPNSPALNAGDDCVLDNTCSPALGFNLTTDQRGTGFPRRVGTHVDIGAFEADYTITPTAGGGQTTLINTAFGTQLKATVKESGVVRAGIDVTFTAPTSGASGTFQGGGTTATVSTDANGVATAPTLTANGVGGSYNVVASLNTSGPLSITYSLVNSISTPSISADVNGTGTQDQACPEQPLTLHANTTGATSYQWYSNGNLISGATSQTYQATSAATYTVTASANDYTTPPSFGYVVQDPTPPKPSVTAGGPTTFCQGGSVTLTANHSTGIQWYKDGVAIPGANSQSYDATMSGSYSAQLNALGCHSTFSDPVTVTVNPAPPTPTINAGGPTTFPAGGSVTLSSSSAAGNQWYKDGLPIAGETNQDYVATTPGSYTVVVTTNGCSSAASAPTVVMTCLSSATVTNTNDSGAGSLRQAIADACPGSTITFDTAGVFSAPQTITLTSGEIVINKNLSLQGPGANALTISGNNTSRVFNVSGGVTATLDHLTVANGKRSGGSINSGGGILNSGTLTITNSTVSGNTASGDSASSNEGGGINNSGTLTITNSTVSNNTASGGDSEGGGIFNSGGMVNITSSTLSGNSASGDNISGGGGIFSSSGTVNTRNTIIAGNSAPNNGPDVFGSFTSQGHNLIGKRNGSAGFTNGTNGDQVGTIDSPLDPKLGPLQRNGGLTRTMALLVSSPAIDAGADVTTLSNSLDEQAATTSVPIANASWASAGLTIQIDDEQMLVTAVDTNTNTLTVTRGANSTTAASHNSGATVNTAFDQRSSGFARKIGSQVDIGAFEANYSISATAGDNLSATINTQFATNLQATAKESGSTQSGISVTFTAPAAGASGTFQTTGTNTVTVTTNSNGVATAPAFTANAVAGGYKVTARLAGGTASADFSLTNAKADQTITFNALSDKTFGDADFNVSAMALSGLAVSFAASGQCTVTGNTVHITAAGPCTVRASQAGDGDYNAAPDVDRPFNITKAATTTTVTINDASYDGIAHGGTAAVTGAGGLNQSLTVTYAGRNTTTYGPSTTAPTSAGDYTASATFNGDANHQGSSDSKNFQVMKSNQTITFNALSDKTFGNVDFNISATTSSGLAVSFAASGQCTVTGNTVHLTGAGSCIITASQAGNSNINAAANIQQTFSIAKADQTITFNALADKTYSDPDFTVVALTSSGLPAGFSVTGNCTITGSTIHITGAGACTVTASQGGDANYNAAASIQRSFNIAAASTSTALTSSLNPSEPGQTVTFTANVSSAASTPTGTVQFKDGAANLGSAVTLSSSGVATFSTSDLTTGAHAITAVYSGDANFATSTGILSGGQQVNANPGLSINNVSVIEGNSGTTQAVFTVTLAQASSQTVKVDFATADGTATAGTDYQSASGTLIFNPGDLSRTITVSVNGDTLDEVDETFFVNLSNPQNSALSDNQGAGTVLNDDNPGVQFSASSYSASEGGGHATITVNRTGDASQPMMVDYMTSDQAGLTPCDAGNGLASQRCDYSIAVGTLRFTAGESMKTILIPIVDDSYTEGSETFTIILSNPTGASLGTQSSATIAITDNDAANGSNPITSADFLVRQFYMDFLGREPEPAGLQGWLNILNNCGTTVPRPCDRVEVASDFYRSNEFQERGFFIYRTYATLGRIPQYSEFMPDFAKVSGFLTEAELEANRAAFVQEFMSRAEFKAKYDPTLSNPTAYVDLLLQTVGLPDHQQRGGWINGLTNQTLARGQVLRALIDSAEVYNKYYNEAFVVEMYFGFLRRDPDAHYLEWIQTLNQTGDYRALVSGFLNSNEYVRRFGP